MSVHAICSARLVLEGNKAKEERKKKNASFSFHFLRTFMSKVELIGKNPANTQPHLAVFLNFPLEGCCLPDHPIT
jgi:hypothetical protein